MKNLLQTIIFCYILSWLPVFFESDFAMNNAFLRHIEFDLSVYVVNMQCCILSALVFTLIQKNHIIQRAVCLVWLLYCVIEAQIYLFSELLGKGLYDISYSTFTVLIIVLFLFTQFKKYNYESDKIKPGKDIYFCFWSPKRFVPTLTSLVGKPFGGMSLYIDGILYGFRWDKELYQAEKVSPDWVQEKFTVYNTKIHTNDVIQYKLNLLVGVAEAGFMRIRCIAVLKQVFKAMDFKISFFDLFPARLAWRVLDGR